MSLRKAKRWTLVVALSTAPLVGCQGGLAIPIWNPFAKPAASGALVQESDREYLQPSMPQAAKTESSWTAPFKKAGDVLTSPFKKSTATAAAKPKSINTLDPISLSTKTGTPTASLYLSIADLHKRSGNTAGAIEEYDKALGVEPKNLQALVGLAHIYDRQGRFDDALKLYRTATDAYPDNAVLRNDMGLCLARANKLSESAVALRRASSLDPSQKLYRNNLATVLVQLGRTDEAYQALVSVHGEAGAHYNVGYLLTKQDRKAEAFQHFAAATNLNPNLAEARQWAEALRAENVPGSTEVMIAAAPTSPPVAQPVAVTAPVQAASPLSISGPLPTRTVAATPASPFATPTVATRPVAPPVVVASAPTVPQPPVAVPTPVAVSAPVVVPEQKPSPTAAPSVVKALPPVEQQAAVVPSAPTTPVLPPVVILPSHGSSASAKPAEQVPTTGSRQSYNEPKFAPSRY